MISFGNNRICNRTYDESWNGECVNYQEPFLRAGSWEDLIPYDPLSRTHYCFGSEYDKHRQSKVRKSFYIFQYLWQPDGGPDHEARIPAVPGGVLPFYQQRARRHFLGLYKGQFSLPNLLKVDWASKSASSEEELSLRPGLHMYSSTSFCCRLP